MKMHRTITLAAILVTSTGCGAEQAQQQAGVQQASRPLRAVPGCEGCEAAWEREPSTLGSNIVLAGEEEPGECLLLQGTVLKPDGTPAPDVVVYIHQTNAAGRYANGSAESEWSRRHGRLRGWLRTGPDGRFEVKTVKPGQYPDRPSPAHIHLTVLEQGKDPYWIDDVVFEGEPGVDAKFRAEAENRGGPGIVRLQRAPSGGWLAKRDIILIPGKPR
jgi:protocatechuate 3,4-dioxygenase beta subunit